MLILTYGQFLLDDKGSGGFFCRNPTLPDRVVGRSCLTVLLGTITDYSITDGINKISLLKHKHFSIITEIDFEEEAIFVSCRHEILMKYKAQVILRF